MGSGVRPPPMDHEVVPTLAAFADRERSNGASIRYVICSTPRSGSTLLGHGLWTSGLGGKPAEYFNRVRYPTLMRRWRTLPPPLLTLAELVGSRLSALSLSRALLSRYTRDLVRYRTGDNGVFGVKIHHSQYAREIAPLPLGALLPGARFVYIRRRDTVRQAVSLLKARQTRRYRATQQAHGVASYDFQALRASHREIEAEERGWQSTFARQAMRPLSLTYEDLVDDYPSTVLSTLRFIGVDTPRGFRLPAPTITKVADTLSEEWVARYRDELTSARHR